MPDAGALDDLVGDLPLVTRRPLFGHPAAFAAGQIFTFVADEERIAVRLPEERAFAEAMGLPGSEGFDPGHDGKPMRHWVVLPATLLDEPVTLREWVRRAHALALRAPATGARRPRRETRAPAATGKKTTKRSAKRGKAPKR